MLKSALCSCHILLHLRYHIVTARLNDLVAPAAWVLSMRARRALLVIEVANYPLPAPPVISLTRATTSLPPVRHKHGWAHVQRHDREDPWQ